MNVENFLDQMSSVSPTPVYEEINDVVKTNLMLTHAVRLITGKTFSGDLTDPRLLAAIVSQLENLDISSLKKEQKSLSQMLAQQYAEETASQYRNISLKIDLAQEKDLFQSLLDITGKNALGVPLSEKEMKTIETGISKIKEIFESYSMKQEMPFEKGVLTKDKGKQRLSKSIPIRYQNGEVYYGICHIPHGIITWDGKMAEKLWKSDKRIVDAASILIRKSKYKASDCQTMRLVKLNGRFVVDPNDALNMVMGTFIQWKDDMDTEKKLTDYVENDGSIHTVDFWKLIQGCF